MHQDGTRWRASVPVRIIRVLVSHLREQFGSIDIYLFDQLLRDRIVPGMQILDVGCGEGRNLIYFLREGYRVFGVDADPLAVVVECPVIGN
jgi:2-polyprenyl-3-methyl-5-hydroxy-6-metoxy-1,4-benzoquinol methylase